ncbi:multiprotein-bridging factor 1 family protein [Streptomyces sp. NPDC002573]|uniref:helix-turn-helix domain-containing protein n=1 Tax=Streptomyces sp. NPDC002573 TaxID=3364651 RepID=UPI003693EC0E
MTAHGDDSETGILRCFGQQLRLLRTSRGLTRAEPGAKLGYGEDMVASVELGRRIPRPPRMSAAAAGTPPSHTGALRKRPRGEGCRK